MPYGTSNSDSLVAGGSRLITQGLVKNACRFEQTGRISWSSISDLSNLIDLFCMYDKVLILGMQADLLSAGSDLRSLLDQCNFIGLAPFGSPGTRQQVRDVSALHLKGFLGDVADDRKYYSLLERVFYDYRHDRWQDELDTTAVVTSYSRDLYEFERGRLILQRVSDHSDVLSALELNSSYWGPAYFVARTFGYLGYAEFHGITLSPDSVRSTVLGPILKREGDLRLELLQSLRAAGEKQFLTESGKELRRRVSPFASIVFDRVRRRADIPNAMFELRRELAPLRERIRQVESYAPKTGPEELAVREKWEAVLDEIQDHFGRGTFFRAPEDLLNYGKVAVDLAAASSGSSSFLTTLLKLPLSAVRALLLRRHAVELFRLEDSIPATAALRAKCVEIFGDIAPGVQDRIG